MTRIEFEERTRALRSANKVMAKELRVLVHGARAASLRLLFAAASDYDNARARLARRAQKGLPERFEDDDAFANASARLTAAALRYARGVAREERRT